MTDPALGPDHLVIAKPLGELMPLLHHLWDIYDDERVHGKPQEAALDAALGRLVNPAKLPELRAFFTGESDSEYHVKPGAGVAARLKLIETLEQYHEKMVGLRSGVLPSE